MKNLTALFCFTFLLLTTLWCSSARPTGSVYRYLEHLDRARDYAAANEDGRALLAFDSAFAEYPTAFGRDLARALEVASRTRDDDRSKDYARRLVLLGSELRYFQQDRYRNFLSSPAWAELEAEFPDLVIQRQARIDTTLRRRIAALYERDQLIAANFNNANVHPRYPAITSDLSEMVAQSGFPGEAVVGLHFTNDTTIGLPHYYVILLHHYHMGRPLFAEQLADFAESGRLDPRHERQFRDMIPADPALVERINARRKASPKSTIYTESFAFHDNAPVFEETYLYPQRSVNLTRRTFAEGRTLLLADWNGDSLFTEVGTDYFGFQWPGAAVPQLYPLGPVNHFVRNDSLFEYRPANNSLLHLPEPAPENAPRILDRLPALDLINGEQPTLGEEPYVITYFWASWCAPCLRTLGTVNDRWSELSQKPVQFVPVALESSPASIDELYRKKGFRFPQYVGAIPVKERFLVRAFPTAYIFRKGRLVQQLSGKELLAYWSAID